MENKKTLCLKVSHYNYNKVNKLLLKNLEERITQ
jgi:hypothetical protein